MKSILKNLYTALTGVCAVAIVVFLIQLIVINSGTEAREPGSVVSEGSASQAGEGQDGEGEDDNPFGGYEPPPTFRPPPQGTRHEILVDVENGDVLVIYAEEDKFDFVEDELSWRFEYKSGGNAVLEICFWALTSQSVGTDAEAFLNSRVEGGGAEYKGRQQIIDSDLTGYCAQAQTGGITYEAWLYSLSGNDLAIAFIIHYEFNGPRDDMYTVLSSMSIEQG